MARKKEPMLIDKNQKRIAEVAKMLFYKKGIDHTKIDDIAQEANMSKSTLYVYFRSKEDIVNYISLEAMTYLHEHINQIMNQEKKELYDVFMAICNLLVSFKSEYPISFKFIIEEICIDENIMEKKPFLKEIYEVGEQINASFYDYFKNEMEIVDEMALKSLIFTLWGSIYGIIELADNKKQYIQKSMNKSKEQFLEESFFELYKVVEGRR